jgi:hypothetical protein
MIIDSLTLYILILAHAECRLGGLPAMGQTVSPFSSSLSLPTSGLSSTMALQRTPYLVTTEHETELEEKP